jgi:hypothetical protein
LVRQAKAALHDPRTVGIYAFVTEILAIDWDDPQRVVRLIDEMDGSDGRDAELRAFSNGSTYSLGTPSADPPR